MQHNPHQNSYSKINRLINSSRLNEAFSLIKQEIGRHESLNALREKIASLESTYQYLLKFMARGLQDPSRQKMLEDIREGLARFNDLILRAELLKASSDPYSSAKRMENLKKSSFLSRYSEFRSLFSKSLSTENKDSAIDNDLTSSLDGLFNYVWTILGSPAEDYELLSDALKDSEFPRYAKINLIGALLLGNTEYYDAEALTLLLDFFETEEDSSLKAYAAVAISIITFLYSQRINRDSQIRSRLLLIKENHDTSNLYNDIILNIVRTYDTKRITRKMNDEVIPSLMKIRPEIIDRMRNIDPDSEDFFSDINPEWEDILEESGLQDKIREISDMQMEGADVMMTTFANLKSFPFFSSVSNWFLPFIDSHPELSAVFKDAGIEDISKLSYAMCDSDLYSFFLSMKSMPEMQRNMMIGNLTAQMRQAEEVLTSAIGETDSIRLQRVIRQNLQNLYRFFNLYRKKDGFKNPFDYPLTGVEMKPLIDLLGINSQTVKAIADFYFKYGYHKEAVGMLQLLEEMNPGEVENWEKIGYCLDREKEYEEALKWYRKAEIINPSSDWLMKKLAICLKNAGNFKEAIKYYKKGLDSDPENYHLLMSAGQCLLEDEKYEEALKEFFHAQYLRPEKKAPKRAIAWTRLMSKDFEKAATEFEKLTDSREAEDSDLLNGALCSLALHDTPSTLNYYRRFLHNNGKDFRKLMMSLRDDATVLNKLGITTLELRLIIDILRYELEDAS